MRTKEKYCIKFESPQKKETGAFYTPFNIAKRMARKTKWKTGETVIDPCCGNGNLLAAMMDTYSELQEENLYGIDIDSEAIEKCKILFPYGHFKVGNCLTDKIDTEEYWNEI